MVIGTANPGGTVLGGTDPDSGALPIDLATGAVDPRGQRLLYASFTAGTFREPARARRSVIVPSNFSS